MVEVITAARVTTAAITHRDIMPIGRPIIAATAAMGILATMAVTTITIAVTIHIGFCPEHVYVSLDLDLAGRVNGRLEG